MKANKEYNLIQKKFLVDKDITQAINSLLVSDYFNSPKFQELYGDILFQKGDLHSALEIFIQEKKYYKAGYCCLLSNDINSARIFFEQAESSPAQNWELFLCQLFDNEVTVIPSYLQLRSFLERDFSAFLKYKLEKHVQKILDISEYLSEINPEINKIIARCFLNYEYFEYSKIYLERAFEFTTQDAELYYLSAKYFLASNEILEAKTSLKKAIFLQKNYLPAIELLEKL